MRKYEGRSSKITDGDTVPVSCQNVCTIKCSHVHRLIRPDNDGFAQVSRVVGVIIEAKESSTQAVKAPPPQHVRPLCCSLSGI